MTMREKQKNVCPCCGYETLEEKGAYDICPICYWEDDSIQLAFPNLKGGANKVSLIDAQKNFVSFGACEERHIKNVRRPTEEDIKNGDWRLIDETKDTYLDWYSESHQKLWHQNKNRELNLYYWSNDFWLKNPGTIPNFDSP